MRPTSVEDNGSGGVWVGGEFDRELSFDGTAGFLVAPHGADDVFLLSFSGDLQTVTSQYAIGSNGIDSLGGLAYVSPGVVAATGSFSGQWDTGGPVLVSTFVDAWLGVVDASGMAPNLAWVHRYGAADEDTGVDVVARNGTLYAVGTIANSTVVEGTSVPAGSAYLLSIGADQSSPVLTVASSEGGAVIPTSVAVTDDDHVVVAGWTEGTNFTVDRRTLAGGDGARHGFVYALDATQAWVLSALLSTDNQTQPAGDATLHDVASRGCRTWVGGTMGIGARSLYTATSSGDDVLILQGSATTEDIFLLGIGN